MKFILLLLLTPLIAVAGGEGVAVKFPDADGKSDIKSSRLVAVYNEKGTPVTPFLQSGKFSAVFSGAFNLAKRSRVYFKFAGFGKAVLKINDEVVVEASGKNLSEVISERLRLNPGLHNFTVEYSSSDDGSGQLRLLWMGRDFPWEPVGPEFLQYEDSAELQQSSLLRHGRQLVAKLNCIKCHSNGEIGAQSMPELNRDAPNLSNAGNRFSESWLAAWIQNPKALRPQASMPSLFKHKSLKEAAAAGDSSSADLAAYLMTKKTESYSDKDLPASYVKEGGDLFHKLGCVSCHSRPGKAGDGVRLPLNNIGWKFSKTTALADFLSNPAKHYKWIKMPDFGLKSDESLKLAVYLMQSSKSNDIGEVKGDAAKGKELYAELGCVSCHEADAKPSASSFGDLKSFDKSCVSGTKVDFSLTDDEKAAVKKFLIEGKASLHKSSPAEFASRQIEEVNCNACHKYDSKVSALSKFHHESSDLELPSKGKMDQSRPVLTWFGEKLQTDYLEKILAGELDHRPRPWLDTRMPAFKARSSLLAEGMAAVHGLSPEKETVSGDKEAAESGAKLIGTKGFNCIICHDAGSQKATAAFEVKGIDLQYSAERLRPNYYLRWMLDPQRIVPHTKMPKFSADGQSAFSDFDNDAAKQFMAMWEFLLEGRKIPAVK